ncbi:MAG TPA: prenyltransferase, partial [Acidobacteria bacterium]|nr:prenyltransferase [Acidobacteriota bacterium]
MGGYRKRSSAAVRRRLISTLPSVSWSWRTISGSGSVVSMRSTPNSWRIERSGTPTHICRSGMAAPHGATGGSAILPGAMAGIRAYLGVARASFLTLPVTLVLCGTGAAVWSGSFRPLRVLLALTGLVALHMAVNILNEVSDFKRGIDLETKRTPFSGGSGTLPMGALSVREATVFGVVCAGVGLAIGVYFLAVIGWPLVPLVAVGAICVLGYTDFLARSGLGEVAAGFGLGSLPVLGTALVQTGHVAPAAVAASVPAFFMTFNLLLLNEFPDEEADRRGGRRNLVLLLGRRWAGRIYAV